jgi:hypothetical protein
MRSNVSIILPHNSFVMLKLGLGGSWNAFGLAEGGPPCSYSGAKAKAAFAAITGCSSNIPLEQESLPLIDGYGDFAFDCRFWDP